VTISATRRLWLWMCSGRNELAELAVRHGGRNHRTTPATVHRAPARAQIAHKRSRRVVRATAEPCSCFGAGAGKVSAAGQSVCSWHGRTILSRFGIVSAVLRRCVVNIHTSCVPTDCADITRASSHGRRRCPSRQRRRQDPAGRDSKTSQSNRYTFVAHRLEKRLSNFRTTTVSSE
jgi:hypothetical protein